MSSIIIAGDTSGSVTLQAPTVAGSTVVTLPSTSMNIGTGGGSISTNTAFGTSALAANTTGSGNTSVGFQAGLGNTTGAQHVFIGYQAGAGSVTATNVVAVGYQAASGATGSGITAIGTSTAQVSTGDDNIAVGASALLSNTTGANNTALGRSALRFSTTGSSNTAVGFQAGLNNTVGQFNVLLGYQAGYRSAGTGSIGDASVFIGYQAGYANQGNNNIGIGNGTLSGNTTGTFNVGVGVGAGSAITTGSKNSILGTYTGSGAPISVTGSNYIIFSDGDGNVKGWFGAGNSNDLFRVGTTSTSTSGWMHQISYSQTSRYALAVTNDTTGANPSGLLVRYPNSGGATNTDYLFSGENSGGLRAGFYNNGGLANFSANNVNLSDRREKTNFAPSKSYLETICAIPVQTFNYVDQDLENDLGLTLGVVAQDVQAVAPELVMESNWGTKEAPKMRLSIYQTDLQYALMKAIQELNAKITALEAKVGA